MSDPFIIGAKTHSFSSHIDVYGPTGKIIEMCTSVDCRTSQATALVKGLDGRLVRSYESGIPIPVKRRCSSIKLRSSATRGAKIAWENFKKSIEGKTTIALLEDE